MKSTRKMEIRLPELSVSDDTATIALWHAEEGSRVEKEGDFVELVTDKAAFDMPAPCAGILTKIIKKQGDEVKKNEIIAIIQEE